MLTAERLEERGRSLWALLDAGVSVDRLRSLDRRVRQGTCTDWLGRASGPEVRNGIPDLDFGEDNGDGGRVDGRADGR